MYVAGISTALPAHRYTQLESWEAIQRAPQFPRLNERSHTLLQRVLTGNNGISTRHFAAENLVDVFAQTPDALQARFEREAPLLAAQAVRQALADAHLRPEDVDALIVSTCTGYLCPGLTGYVSELVGLPTCMQAYDLVGQGCAAALPNLALADALVGAGRARHVVSVCVEICCAAVYLDDDPGVLISACLFGDGAAAAVLSAKPAAHQRRVEWVGSRSLLAPEARDLLRFEHRDGMLRNILTRAVPGVAAEYADEVIAGLLAEHSLAQGDIASWIIHAGGRDVLAALRRTLGLTAADLQLSADVLRDVGNVSSPFVMFVLERALAAGRPGGWWCLSSFGAGFACHGALLRVE